MDSTYKARVQYFKTTLSSGEDDEEISPDWKPVVDMKTFREACFYGIPDESCVRATAWKVLLGYLPPDKRMWNDVLTSQRLCYYNLVKDLLQDPGGEPPSNDHPLNAEPGSKWAAFFHDNTILEQIDKDVRRTLPDLAFFQSLVPKNPLNPLSPPSSTTHIDEDTTSKVEPDHPLGIEGVEKPTNRKLSLSFIGGRSRSSSTASKKSFKGLTNNDANRSRSNSKSSVRSSHSVAIADGSPSSTPRSIVRKFSSAFKLNNVASSSTTSLSKKKHGLHNVKPICPYVTNRRTIFSRIAHLNLDSSTDEKPAASDIRRLGDAETQDHHWEAIERLLFIYAKLNPGVGYVQGMNELLAPIYYVFAKDNHPDAQAHAEADAFFVFTTLMADVRDHFVRSLDHDASTGINATMQRMSLRLSWVDRSLWRDLKKKDIKEQYYAFRWITVMCCQEWDLPDVIRLWDSLLADRQSTDDDGNVMTYEFLLDFTVAMLIAVRKDLLSGDFAENMRMLQNYPVEDIQNVLKIAYSIREKRLKAVAAGQTVPGVNDKRNSGLLSYDWSDTSSIASNGSSRLQRLRETTDMARHSIEAFRKESRESLDEFFRTHRAADPTDIWKRASTGEMTRSLSQKLASMGGGLASKMRRSSSVNNPNDIQRHKDPAVPNTLDNHNRRMSTLSNPNERAGTLPNRTSSLRNRLNQIMNSNTTISPYNRLKSPSTSTQSSSTLSPIYTRSSSNDGNKDLFSSDKESREYNSGYI